MSDLLPCPFCGSDIGPHPINRNTEAGIACLVCGAWAPRGRWQTRAAASAPVEVERALRTAIERLLRYEEPHQVADLRAALRATPGGGEQDARLDAMAEMLYMERLGGTPWTEISALARKEWRDEVAVVFSRGYDATPAEPAGCAYVYTGEERSALDGSPLASMRGVRCCFPEDEHPGSHPFQSEAK